MSEQKVKFTLNVNVPIKAKLTIERETKQEVRDRAKVNEFDIFNSGSLEDLDAIIDYHKAHTINAGEFPSKLIDKVRLEEMGECGARFVAKDRKHTYSLALNVVQPYEDIFYECDEYNVDVLLRVAKWLLRGATNTPAPRHEGPPRRTNVGDLRDAIARYQPEFTAPVGEVFNIR